MKDEDKNKSMIIINLKKGQSLYQMWTKKFLTLLFVVFIYIMSIGKKCVHIYVDKACRKNEAVTVSPGMCAPCLRSNESVDHLILCCLVAALNSGWNLLDCFTIVELLHFSRGLKRQISCGLALFGYFVGHSDWKMLSFSKMFHGTSEYSGI